MQGWYISALAAAAIMVAAGTSIAAPPDGKRGKITLSDLDCTTDEIVLFDVTDWVCSDALAALESRVDQLDQLGPGANLAKADLSGMDLTGLDLTGANLVAANLIGADLSGADLTGANLIRANMTNADVIGTNFTSAKLTDANITNADMTDADLTRAWLRSAIGQLVGVPHTVIWGNTICPDGSNSDDADGDDFTCGTNYDGLPP